jgi:hypothetical protein
MRILSIQEKKTAKIMSAIAHYEWEEVKVVASRGIEKVEHSTLSRTAKHTVLAIGGLTKVVMMTQKEEPWLIIVGINYERLRTSDS